MTFPATPNDTAPGTPRGTVSYVYGSATCPDPNNKDAHYLYSATDEGGHATVYLRDTKYRVITINYPDGGVEKYTYDPTFGNVATHQLKAGGTETYSYYNVANGDPASENGLAKEYRDAYHTSGNANLRYQYDSFSRLSAGTDALCSALGDANHTTSYLYNSRGQLTTKTLPIDPNDHTQHTVVNGYDNNTGNLMSVKDELGNITSYTYDDYHRMRTMVSPGHNTPVTTTYFYDATGSGENYKITPAAVTFLVLPAGEITKNVWDNNFRKSSVTVGYNTSDAATTQYGYDNNDNLTTVTDPLNHPSSTKYDQRNRIMSTTDALNNATSILYDAAGRKASVTRANGQLTTLDSYDAMNRLLQQTAKQTPDPDVVTKYTYYPSGLLKTMQDPQLIATSSSYSYSYQYDLMGRKQQLTYPPDSGSVQRTEAWAYDNTGNGVLYQFTNRKGNIQTFGYDNFNRVTSSTWNDGITPGVTTAYDAASRVTGITNSNSAITRTYFNDNLLNTETNKYADGISRTVTYTFDADGRRASLAYPNNAYTFTYTYTKRSQLDLIQSGGTTIVNHGYDLNGNLNSRVLNNSTSSTYGYDWMNSCNSITHTLNGTTRTLTYNYDSVRNRQWVKRDGGLGDAYGYDLADQANATQFNIANPDTAGPGSVDVVYDANGNRTSFSANGPTDTYPAVNNLNQYPSRNGVSAAYDSNGNTTTGFDGSSYVYDAQNRLTSASKSGTTDTFLYDGMNRQIGKKQGTGAMYYRVYDGWGLLGEYKTGTTGAYWAYLYGASGVVKNLITNNYYYQDASGSTSHAANSSGTLKEYYRYDLHGAPLFFNASGQPLSDTAIGVRHLFITTVLQTRIHRLKLKPLDAYNPGLAIAAIQNANEVASAQRRLGVEPPVIITDMNVVEPTHGLPHLPSTLTDVTVDQALDLVAKTFKGVVSFGVCDDPGRSGMFDVDILQVVGWRKEGAARKPVAKRGRAP
jgi:YD repeat-containing protein